MCYLVDFVRDERASVVITTHYIEEARQAQKVSSHGRGNSIQGHTEYPTFHSHKIAKTSLSYSVYLIILNIIEIKR